jgi:TIR domain
MAEFNWDRLLRRICDGAVVPVIGQELMRQEVDGKSVTLGGLIAQRLAKSLEIEVEQPPFFELNAVVSAYLSRPGTVPTELYQDIAWAYKEIIRDLPVPPALMKLAGIEKFDLFVNLGIDSMLATALDRTRFAGSALTRQVAFSINQSTDSQDQALKPPPEGTPVVFNLFGYASSTDDYVIHDEDALEFIHRLVSGDVEPPAWLLSRLRGADLLVLGAHLPDWLGRFVLRAATRDRLMQSRRGYFIARENATQAATLDEFLRRFGRETRIHVYDGPAEVFVDELARRWLERNPPQPGDVKASEPAPVQEGSIFISYGRENLAEVTRLHEQISGLGGDAWFDKDELMPGEQWERTILRKIQKDVKLFIPVVSTRTVERARTEGEAYVFKEWRQAISRAEKIVGRKFIIPVVIDTEFSGALTPYQSLLSEFPELDRYNFGAAPAGVLTDTLKTQLVQEIRNLRREEVR